MQLYAGKHENLEEMGMLSGKEKLPKLILVESESLIRLLVNYYIRNGKAKELLHKN